MFVLGSGGHTIFRNPKKTHDSLFVGQEPRLHGSNGDPETHSRSGLGQVPANSTWCTFLAVEIAKRKPG